jgi:hypothetical protein
MATSSTLQLVLLAFYACMMSCVYVTFISAGMCMCVFNGLITAMSCCFMSCLYLTSCMCDYISTRLQMWLYNIPRELTLADYSAATAAMDKKMRAEVLPTLPPTRPKQVQQMPAALLKQNAADRSAALAARAAANAGQTRLTPEERAAALARSRAAAAARENRLRASDAETGIEERIDRARCFASEHAAQQQTDVIEQRQLTNSQFEQEWAICMAQNPHLAPKKNNVITQHKNKKVK